MAIRIERKSLTVTPTHDPNIVKIEAEVTTDEAGKKNPKMERVEVFWNINTPFDTVKSEMAKKVKGNTLQDTLRAALGENVLGVD